MEQQQFFSDDSSYSQLSQQQQSKILETEASQISFQFQQNVNQIKKKFQNNQKIIFEKILSFQKKIGIKSVCAKITTRGQSIVHCFDCGKDSSCIICMDCFKQGNHQNHKHVIKTAYGGCCDCGDSEAWAKQGFCKNHSGQLLDVNIPPNQIAYFITVFEQLFYLYLKNKIEKPLQSQRFYSQLINYLIMLNKDSLYYNKLTTLLLSRRIKKQIMPLPQGLNNISIFANILKFTSETISQKSVQLYLMMFPYYPFKQLLLSNYFKYYHLIYDGSSTSQAGGSSIACQILTSNQLVDDYVKNQQQIGLGQHLKPKSNMKKTNNNFYQLAYDFRRFTKIQGETPQNFWKFQIRRGLDQLFISYQKFKAEAEQEMNYHQKAVQYIDLSQVEFKILQLCLEIFYCLKDDRQTKIIFLKYLFNKVKAQDQKKTIPIFRPYQRAFGIALFAYFEMDLNNCQNNLKKELIKILQITQEQFQFQIIFLKSKMFKTYFYHSKIVSEPGLGTTYAHYFYFYKHKGRMMMSIDVILLKMCILMIKGDPVISPQKIIQLQEIQKEQEEQEKNLSNKKLQMQKYLLHLKEISHLYISKIGEIYLAISINPSSDLYEKQIKDLIITVCFELKDQITKENIKIMEDSFLHPNAKIIQKYLKQICIFWKEKKKFQLKQQFIPKQGINYNDFRTNFKSQNLYQDIKKSTKFIGQIQKIILNKIWSEQTIKKNIKVFYQLFSKFNNSQNQSMKALVYEYYRIYEILNQCKNQHAKIIYNKVLNVTEIQKFLPQNLKIKSLNLSLSSLEKIKSEQDQRKKKIKLIQVQKMLLFKKKQQKVAQSMKLLDVTSKMDNQQQKQQQNLHCAICKNKRKQQMIYLCKTDIRNYQKLYGVSQGKGVECISFKSCYHTFDYKCILDHVKQISYGGFKCPLCRQIANCFMPYDKNKQIAFDSMSGITQVMYNYKDYITLDIHQQIIKSFYHYALLCLIDFQHTIKKKLTIYKHVLMMVKTIFEEKELKQLMKKFLKKKFVMMHLQKSQLQKQKQKEQISYGNRIASKIKNIFLNSQENNQQSLDQNSDSDNEVDPGLQDTSQSIDLLSVFSENTKNTKKKFIKVTTKNQKQQKIDQQSNLFKNVVYKILCNLLKIDPNFAKYDIKPLPEDIQKIISTSIDILFDQESNSACLMKLSTQQCYKPENMTKFRALPSRYTPLGKIKQCSFCQEITGSLVLCLYCSKQNVSLCVRCKNKNSSIISHAQKYHGNLCPFLFLSTTSINVCVNKQILEVGQAYKDQYGNSFKLQGNWDQYQLDQLFLEDIKNHLDWDQIQTKAKRYLKIK